MRKLIDVYRITGDSKFIKPLPGSLRYYQKSALPDGRLARFYELQTNRPLYFTTDYQLTYSDADLPTHYSFKVGSKLESIERAYREVLTIPAQKLKPVHAATKPARLSSGLAKKATAAVRALDSRGAWVEQGKMRHQEEPIDLIDMRTFVRNLETLARYAGATR